MHLLDLITGSRRIASGRAAGLTIMAWNADPSMVSGNYEAPVQRAVADHLDAGDVFYDIGANIGFFSFIAARCVGEPGRVYAFEPLPRNVRAIRRGALRNDFEIEVFPYAVGAFNGDAELRKARHIGGAMLASAGMPPDDVGRVTVKIVRLDHAIRQYGLRPPTLVKIDVEGAELDVLQGMPDTLRRHRPKILLELDDASLPELRCRTRAVAAFLHRHGYEVSTLPPAYPGLAWHVEHVMAAPVVPS